MVPPAGPSSGSSAPSPDAGEGATSPHFDVEVSPRSYELDAFGHVNHAVFLNYLEFARFEALEAGGFPVSEQMRRGWGVYVARIEVDYLKEARLGDRLRVRTHAEEPRRSSVVIVQEITRTDDPAEAVVRARVTAVWVGEGGRPMRVPDEIRTMFGFPPGARPRDG